MAVVYFNLVDYPKFTDYCDKHRDKQSYSSSLVAEGYPSAKFEKSRRLIETSWAMNDTEYLMFQLKWS
jgi:hypothetical protein